MLNKNNGGKPDPGIVRIVGSAQLSPNTKKQQLNQRRRACARACGVFTGNESVPYLGSNIGPVDLVQLSQMIFYIRGAHLFKQPTSRDRPVPDGLGGFCCTCLIWRLELHRQSQVWRSSAEWNARRAGDRQERTHGTGDTSGR